MMTKEQIGSTLKQLRLQTGKTQKEVAELLGRKQQIVGHWETGYAQPDANTLFLLCEIYGTTVDAAFGFNKKDVSVSKNDLVMIEKYHALDEHGKELVDFILNKEHSRCRDYTAQTDAGPVLVEVKEHKSRHVPSQDAILADYFNDGKEWKYEIHYNIPSMVAEASTYDVAAAHNDHVDESGELEKMKADLETLKRPK